MPRLQIIILDQPEATNPRLWRYALWADVPVARQSIYAASAGPTAASEWLGALTADNVNLQSRAVVETTDTLQVPPGATLAQIKSYLIDRWTAFQAHITNDNPWTRYGTIFDGTTWTPGGVT